MTTPSRLVRLKEQYRKVRLRDEIQEDIARGLSQAGASADAASMPSRWASGRVFAFGAAALAAGVLFAWGLDRPAKLDAVVSAVQGQAFGEAGGTQLLHRDAHVVEGQRLRTFASSTVETLVGAHVVAVSADSSLILESLLPRDLVFRLERGRVNLTVSPLAPGKRLRVRAGDLTVEVVGTVFSVQREGDCSAVSVRAGRVAILHQGQAGQVRAGEERRFCPAAAVVAAAPPSPAPTPGPLNSGVRSSDTGTTAPSVQRNKIRLEPDQALPPVEFSLPTTEPLSDEERLFRDASRTAGGASWRAARLQEYLARFPSGMFVEDALFQLVRDSYASAESAQVVHFSEQFLRRSHRGRRTSEVQLLYVHSLIELGRPPGQSLGVVEALLSHLDSLPRHQREQATYLAILAYCDSPRPQSCRQWIDRYIERYPHGLYADEVRRRLGTQPRSEP